MSHHTWDTDPRSFAHARRIGWSGEPTPTRLSSHIRLSCRPLSLHLAATAALALTLGRRHHPAEISGEQETERVLLLVLLPSTARAKMRIDQ